MTLATTYVAIWALMALLAITGLHRYFIPVVERDGLRARGSKVPFVILIRKGLDAEGRKETLAHERRHVWQGWVLPPLTSGLLYLLSPWCRRWMEAQAYAESYKCGRDLHDCARALAFYHLPGRETDANVQRATAMILRFAR